ncbi:MAG: zinc ribbon domain-containing protein [Pseudomonadota bacterium]
MKHGRGRREAGKMSALVIPGDAARAALTSGRPPPKVVGNRINAAKLGKGRQMSEAINCPSCGNQVSPKAFDCPQCGHPLRKPKRGFFGKIFKWSLILFNILMIVWMVSYLGTIGSHLDGATSEAEEAGMAIGGTIGVGMILVFWVLGDIILGLATLLTRPSR